MSSEPSSASENVRDLISPDGVRGGAGAAIVPGIPANALQVPPPDRRSQEVWFALARREWSALALVPVDSGESAADLATSMAEVGRRLRASRITPIVATTLEYTQAAAITSTIVATRQGASSRVFQDRAQVVVAIPPIVDEPLGAAVAQAADAAILCVRLGRSKLSAVRRAIELIGREKVAGCVLLR
jgi:hypothetical protein